MLDDATIRRPAGELGVRTDFAEKTRFGGRIVHGTLGSGLISSVLACLPGLSIYRSRTFVFEGPVQIRETLTARCEIEDDLDGDRYRLTTRVENGEGERVLDGTATVLVDSLPVRTPWVALIANPVVGSRRRN